MIPLLRKTTGWTFMPTITKFFWNTMAACACLAGHSWVYGYDLRTDFVSFVRQDVYELPPSSIRNRSSQPVVLEHTAYVQALHNDESKSVDQLTGNFIMMIAPLVSDASVNTLQPDNFFVSVRPTTLLPGNRSLGYPQFGQRLLQVPWIWFLRSIRVREEVCQANINTNWREATRLNGSVWKFTAEHNVPFSGCLLYGNILDFTFKLPVQFDFDLSNVLDVQPISGEFDTIAVCRERNGIEVVFAFESWVSRLTIASLNTTKEASERFIQSAHCGLNRGVIESREERVDSPLPLEPPRTIIITDGHAEALISEFPVVKAGVVETPMRLKRDSQFSLLVAVREQSIAEGLNQSLSLLVFNVTPDCGFTDRPNCASVIRPTPQAWQTRTKNRKLLAQNPGRDTLETVDNFSNTPSRISLDEQVDMIWHYFHSMNSNSQFFGFFGNKLAHSGFYFTNQDRPSVLWTKDNVILQREYGPSVFPVSCFHTGIIL